MERPPGRHPFTLTPPETVNRAPRDSAAASGPIRLLLVEDDDGDALLVEELFNISGAYMEIIRVTTLAEARRENLAEIDCVLLDLDLPDAQGLAGLHRLKTDRADVAVLVLTGLDDERRGMEAVGAGAQDYLVKGQIDGQGLTRAVHYAVERLRADEARRELEVARLHAEENARLERGLLPAPLVNDDHLVLNAHYRPGPSPRAARRRLLRRGPDRRRHRARRDRRRLRPRPGRRGARRVAADRLAHAGDRRPLDGSAAADAAGRPRPRAPPLVDVHDALHGRRSPPTSAALTLRLAGHPPPLLITADGIESLEPAKGEPPLGVVDDARWTAYEHTLPEQWSLLLYTDGLIEGRTGVGNARLGGEGLAAMLRGLDTDAPGLVATLVERAEELNGGPLLDDVAAFVVRTR